MNQPHPKTLIDGTVEDCATALMVSFDRLNVAAKSVNDLLRQAGFAGAKGDTADDLHLALALHGHLLQQFQVKIRTVAQTDVFTLSSESSYGAYRAAVERHGDTPCGVTVMPADDAVDPDRAALADAHRALRVSGTLDLALKIPALSRALHSYARKHRRRTTYLAPNTPDFKQRAANDLD